MRMLTRSQIQIELRPWKGEESSLLDRNTGLPPDFNVSSSMAFLFAWFDQQNNIVNASTLSALTVEIFDGRNTMNLLTRSSVTEFRGDILIQDWRNIADQQAVITIDPIDPEIVPFDANGACRGWMVIKGATLDGNVIVMATGPVMLRAGASDYVYLPLNPIPTIIPKGTVYFIPAGVTITFPTPPVIDGTIILEPSKDGLPAGAFVILDP